MAWKLPPDTEAMGGALGAPDAPLWLQSGMQSAPPPAPYQRGDMLRNMPPARSVGYGEAIANALLPRMDEQGYKGPGIGDAINAALWVVPGMRGTIKPRQFTKPPPAENANIAPPRTEVDALSQSILDHPKYGLLARQPAESLSNPFLKRNLANMEARGNQRAQEVAAQLPANATANDLFELLFKRKPPK